MRRRENSSSVPGDGALSFGVGLQRRAASKLTPSAVDYGQRGHPEEHNKSLSSNGLSLSAAAQQTRRERGKYTKKNHGLMQREVNRGFNKCF